MRKKLTLLLLDDALHVDIPFTHVLKIFSDRTQFLSLASVMFNDDCHTCNNVYIAF